MARCRQLLSQSRMIEGRRKKFSQQCPAYCRSIRREAAQGAMRVQTRLLFSFSGHPFCIAGASPPHVGLNHTSNLVQ